MMQQPQLTETLDFLGKCHKKLPDLYLAAHRSTHELPEYALVQARACGLRIATTFMKGRGCKPDGRATFGAHLANDVFSEGTGKELASLLDRLRGLGNIAAHPEQSRKLPGEPVEVAIDALRVVCQAAGFVCPTLCPPPFVMPDRLESDRLCGEAVLRHNREAQYLLGLRARKKADEAMRTTLQKVEGAGGVAGLAPAYRGYLEQAFHWFHLAAHRFDPSTIRERCNWEVVVGAWDWDFDGHPGATFELARAYVAGWGVAPDVKFGLGLLDRAAEVYHPAACALIGHFFLTGRISIGNYREDTDTDYGAAREYLEVAAEAEHPDALLGLAKIYFEGLGVARDETRGLEHLRRAASDYPSALAGAYLAGIGLPSDGELVALLETAAAAGQAEACRLLFDVYRDGLCGVPRDREKAARWGSLVFPPELVFHLLTKKFD